MTVQTEDPKTRDMITGNGQTFAGPEDLTDITHDTILAVLLVEVSRTDITPEGAKASIRAIKRVERLALAAGWTPQCAAILGVVAGDLYGQVLADAARMQRESGHR